MKNKIFGAALLIAVSTASASAFAGQSYIYFASNPQSHDVIVVDGWLCKTSCTHTAFTISANQYYSVPLDQITYDTLKVDSVRYTGPKGEKVTKYFYDKFTYDDNKMITFRFAGPESNWFIVSETAALGSTPKS